MEAVPEVGGKQPLGDRGQDRVDHQITRSVSKGCHSNAVLQRDLVHGVYVDDECRAAGRGNRTFKSGD